MWHFSKKEGNSWNVVASWRLPESRIDKLFVVFYSQNPEAFWNLICHDTVRWIILICFCTYRSLVSGVNQLDSFNCIAFYECSDLSNFSPRIKWKSLNLGCLVILKFIWFLSIIKSDLNTVDSGTFSMLKAQRWDFRSLTHGPLSYFLWSWVLFVQFELFSTNINLLVNLRRPLVYEGLNLSRVLHRPPVRVLA